MTWPLSSVMPWQLYLQLCPSLRARGQLSWVCGRHTDL